MHHPLLISVAAVCSDTCPDICKLQAELRHEKMEQLMKSKSALDEEVEAVTAAVTKAAKAKVRTTPCFALLARLPLEPPHTGNKAWLAYKALVWFVKDYVVLKETVFVWSN